MSPNFDWSQISWDCYPFAWELSSTLDTSAGVIATTWTYPDFTDIYTLDNGATTTETYNFWGTPLASITTTSTKTSPVATGSMASKTAGSKTTGSASSNTLAAPTSSKTTSGAVGGFKLSYGAGGLVALSVLAFLL